MTIFYEFEASRWCIHAMLALRHHVGSNVTFDYSCGGDAIICPIILSPFKEVSLEFLMEGHEVWLSAFSNWIASPLVVWVPLL